MQDRNDAGMCLGDFEAQYDAHLLRGVVYPIPRAVFIALLFTGCWPSLSRLGGFPGAISTSATLCSL